MLQHFIYRLAFIYNLQKEVNYKITEVVFKESNNNNNTVFCLHKSHLPCLNPFSLDYSSWLNYHVHMLITVRYMDIYNIAYTSYI